MKILNCAVLIAIGVARMACGGEVVLINKADTSRYRFSQWMIGTNAYNYVEMVAREGWWQTHPLDSIKGDTIYYHTIPGWDSLESLYLRNLFLASDTMSHCSPMADSIADSTSKSLREWWINDSD